MIVDANVAVYWFVPTPMTAMAAKLLERSDLVAPGIIQIEVVNSFARYLRAGLITSTQLREGIAEVRNAISQFVDDRQILDAATDIALAHDHSVYDCLYLALALERREPLATADKRLATLAGSLAIETTLIVAMPQ